MNLVRFAPSRELNAIQTALTLKLVSLDLIEDLRENPPKSFSTIEPECICQHFTQGIHPLCPWLNDHVLGFSFMSESVYRIKAELLLFCM